MSAMAGGRNPVCLKDFEEIARINLPKNAFDYYQSGADAEQTLRDNEAAFRKYRLRPKHLRDVSNRDLRTSILGQEIAFPIAVSPTAMQRMAHPEGEVATARAATSLGTGVILSSWSTSSIEEVAAGCSPIGPRWFQLYVYKDRDVIRDLVRRAEREGYKALFVTVDTPILGRRRADVRNKFALPPHLRLANFDLSRLHSSGVHSSEDSGLAAYVASLIDPSLNWEHIEWLKSITSLPIILKGILTAEDAKLAVEHNVSGILVSNHGARQLDGVLATIDALNEVVQAVRGSNVEVYLDGGVRTGTDVLKALALGARAVFIGRPSLWGLAYNGEAGVREVLELIRDEFKLAMALSGCTCIADITPDLIQKDKFLLMAKM
ncbi:hydroxyacid oxidase 1-like [Acanthaster planci]|uniref:(S)-2-hydroxy-acid oxidase n=1 Tax=Acanthaster planci TaxID=133434 RepID=A0A8B7YZU0_ACAPL|nr:hydroxyacid oxidase 1-like [Acanthaster planci]